MSDDSWQNDWITDNTSELQSTNVEGLTNSTYQQYEIHENNGYGNVTAGFRPTVKVLKRDKKDIEQRNSQLNTGQSPRLDYKAREEHYERVREKIFGTSSRNDSKEEMPTANVKSSKNQ